MPQLKYTDRRKFIAALSGCLLAISAPEIIAKNNVSPHPSNAIDDLIQISNALCGTSVSNRTLAKEYLKILEQYLDRAQLDALLDLNQSPPAQWAEKSRTAPIQEGAEFALQLWMAGMTQGENSQVLTYTDAPIWSALSSFTKPPAVCGGGFGYWSEPPA